MCARRTLSFGRCGREQDARKRCGDGVRYVQIFEANKSLIRDADLIYPGQIFDLPAAN